jgi:hypothetical protein
LNLTVGGGQRLLCSHTKLRVGDVAVLCHQPERAQTIERRWT